MIVTIDGPAGAGKSSVARAVARRLRFRFLDTGAMYRAVALAGLRQRVDWQRPEQLAEVAKRLDLRFDGRRMWLGGEDITEAVRTSQVTAATRFAADNPAVRGRLVELQRQFAAEAADIVTEGRDQGTVVFPNAECKIFLTASPEERARRRVEDLRAQGEAADFDEVLAAQQRRDREDAERPVGALVAAADAIEVLTDGMSFEEVVDRLENIVRGKRGRG